ncbi:MAG: hypothetical protein GF419_10905 [Ignavibacteriales bacterium]|nr:hypothetical protein [Ignavibacteriales bacterium]
MSDRKRSLFRRRVSDKTLRDDALALYLDALRLDRRDDLADELLEHVRDCPVCRREILRLDEALREEDFSALGPHPLLDQEAIQEEERRRRKRSWTIFGVVAAVVLAAAVYAYLLVDRKIEEERAKFEQEIMTDSISLALRDSLEAIAEREELRQREAERARQDPFRPNDALENLLTMEIAPPGLTIHSPEVGDTLVAPITFSWSFGTPEQRYVTVFSNAGVHDELEVKNDAAVMNETPPPGVYYWKLSSMEDLLYIGKFYVAP